MPTPTQAHDLITARNSAQSLCTRILALTRDMPVQSVAADLSKAKAMTRAVAGVEMDDSEAVAMAALVDAASNLLAVAAANGPTIMRPTNWRTELPAVDVALRALSL